MSAAMPSLKVNCPCETGEGPLWHPAEACVYWVDIPVGRIYRLFPASGRVETFDVGVAVGGLTLEADGRLLLFMADGAIARWHNGALEDTIVDSLPEEQGNRFNDVIADPEGRVFCGTMSTPKRAGRLYRLDRDHTIHCLLEGIGTSNGMGFTPDSRQLYYTDTRRHCIYLFDYDRQTGAISHQRPFVHVPEDAAEGRPDGLTVDREGCVWSARWAGGCIVRYAPDGTELQRLKLPVHNVSSLTFGGPDYSDLYITTAGGHQRSTTGDVAGALFHWVSPVPGVPEFVSRIGTIPRP